MVLGRLLVWNGAGRQTVLGRSVHNRARPVLKWPNLACIGLTLGLGLGCGATNSTAPQDGTESGDTDTDTETAPSGVEETVAALAETQCMFVEACACGNALADPAMNGDDCELSIATRWQTRLDEGAARELTLDADCLTTTLARMNEQSCRWPASNIGHVCESFCAVYYGDRALGSTCTASDALVSDCASGLTCSGGTCVEPCGVLTGLRLGETCRSAETNVEFDDCAPGLRCDWDARTCLSAAQIGDSCDNGCSVGLWCDWESNRCREPADEGSSCGEIPCRDGLSCDWQADVCRPLAQSGESCDSLQCAAGLSCDSSQTCGSLPIAGESCPQGLCSDEAVCDWTVGSCVGRPLVGSRCVVGECAEQLWCDSSDPQEPDGPCTERLARAEACSGHQQCETGYCPAGYCLDKPLLGEGCAGAMVCGQGLVCDGVSCIETRTRGPAACVYNGW